MTYISEVLKQYVFVVEGLQMSIKARITKRTNEDGDIRYTWEVSHYASPKGNISAYRPGTERMDLDSFELAERFLMLYAKEYDSQQPEPNPFY